MTIKLKIFTLSAFFLYGCPARIAGTIVRTEAREPSPDLTVKSQLTSPQDMYDTGERLKLTITNKSESVMMILFPGSKIFNPRTKEVEPLIRTSSGEGVNLLGEGKSKLAESARAEDNNALMLGPNETDSVLTYPKSNLMHSDAKDPLRGKVGAILRPFFGYSTPKNSTGTKDFYVILYYKQDGKTKSSRFNIKVKVNDSSEDY